MTGGAMSRAKGSAFDREPLGGFPAPTTGLGDGGRGTGRKGADFRRADGQEAIGSRNDIGGEGLEEALSLHTTGRSRPRPLDAAMGFARRREREGLGGKEVHGGQEAWMGGSRLRGSIWRWRLESGLEWWSRNLAHWIWSATSKTRPSFLG